jgi:hypothetical protein
LSQGGAPLDANPLQRLLDGDHPRSSEAAKQPPSSPQERPATPNLNAGTVVERGELVFLPLDTPVWHLPTAPPAAARSDNSPYLVTRAENVEWMRMIWGKMTDASSVLEALGKQARQAGEEKQRQQQQEQQQQQQQMLSQLSQLLGGQKNAPSAPAASNIDNNTNTNNLAALLSQVLGSAAPQQHQAPPQQSRDRLLQSLQWELEVAMAKQQSQSLPRHPSNSSLGPGHRRNTSMEISSIFDGPSSFPGFNPPAPRHQRTSSTGGTFHHPPAPQPVRANLLPGSVQPGQGQFYVISADARIQLTENGFYLAVVSGPHEGFDTALEALALWTHRRPSMREDTDMVHIRSDTPIWHSTDLLHGQPLMIVKSSSLLEVPRPLKEPATHSRSQSLGGQESQGNAQQLATNQFLNSLAELSKQMGVEQCKADSNGGLSNSQLQQLAMLQGMVNIGKQEPSRAVTEQKQRGVPQETPSMLDAVAVRKEAHVQDPGSQGNEGLAVSGSKRPRASSPPSSSALPNKKAHMLRWQAAHPDGETSQPGSSALNGDAGGGGDDDSDTESAELDATNACAPTTAHGDDTATAEADAKPSGAHQTLKPNILPRPSPLKVPGVVVTPSE